MSLMYHDTVIAGTPVIDSAPTAGSNHAVSSGGVKSAINSVENDIAIRVVGNKTTYASGAAIGQYVIVDGSTITGITDGMYKAVKAIPYNTAIDSTYLTAVSGGGLNELKDAIDTSHEMRLEEIKSNITSDGTVTIDSSKYRCLWFVYWNALFCRRTALYPINFLGGSSGLGLDFTDGNNRNYFLIHTYNSSTQLATYLCSVSSGNFQLYGEL